MVKYATVKTANSVGSWSKSVSQCADLYCFKTFQNYQFAMMTDLQDLYLANTC